MIKKTLFYSFKALKISTWISAIAVLLVVLLVGFFVIFPTFLKAPIEQQLSSVSGLDIELSKITFGFEGGNITINVHNIDVGSVVDKTTQPLVSVQNLHWKLDWFSVFDDIYNPSEVEVDILSIYSQMSGMSMADIYAFMTPEVLDALALFKTVRVDKTIVAGNYNFELSPLILNIDKQQLKLNISQQMLGGKTFDISANFLLEQLAKQANLSLPIMINSQDFKLHSKLILYRQNNNDFIEFNGKVQRMNMRDILEYLPPDIVGKLANKWMNLAFKSGVLDDINIGIKQNMTQQNEVEVNFNAHLSNGRLLFDSNWPILQNLDADISTNGKQLKVGVNSGILSPLPLQNIAVEITDMTQDVLVIKVMGKVDSHSQTIIDFLQNTPLNAVVEPILDKFILSGKAVGDIDLVIPLNETPPIIDVDLYVSNNHLTVLDGAIKVKDFNSEVGFHNNIISTKGSGNIRGEAFNIRVNPSNRGNHKKAIFAVELLNQKNQFNAYISQQSPQLWRAKIKSEAVKTAVEIALDDTHFPTVTLQDLTITTLDKIKGDWKILPNDLPSMHLKSQNIRVDDYQFPDFKVDLHSAKDVLNINNLEFDGIGVNQNNLSFNGHWLRGITTLIASAKGEKLSDFLQQLKIKEPVKGGEFDFDIRLFCDCNPWNMNLKNISGYAQMSVKEGVFTEQDPNIGRVLSLLNIQSVARRLKLKTSDLTSTGFVYDDIQASVYLGDSLAKIENFELNATSSSIYLSGNSNIVNQQYDVLATVRPAISNSVPIATYLAGGGLAGLGVWAVDKLLFDGKVMDSVVDNVAEFNYKISGSWDNPIIE